MRILFCAVFILIYEDVTIIIFLTFWKATVNDIKCGSNFYKIEIMQQKNICIVATEGHGPTRTCREKNNSTPIRCEKNNFVVKKNIRVSRHKIVFLQINEII